MNLLYEVKGITKSTDLRKNTLNSDLKKYKSIYIFGAGSYGQYFGKTLISNGYNIVSFIDNNKKRWGKTIIGLPIISPEELSVVYTSDMLVLVCSTWHEEIQLQLKDMGIKSRLMLEINNLFQMLYIKNKSFEVYMQYFLKEISSFEKLNEMFKDQESRKTFQHLLAYRISGNASCLIKSPFKQYFHPAVQPMKGDVIIDGGAFIGDTAERFNDFLESNCVIHSFEPSGNNYIQMKRVLENRNLKNIVPVKAGLGEKTETLYMNPNGETIDAGYVISNDGSEEIVVVSLDDYVKENGLESVDFIKLDIEGFELKALEGAVETLKRFKPRLQICLYHKLEDMVAIPSFLREVFEGVGYSFYLGHHSESYLETVLYAICE